MKALIHLKYFFRNVIFQTSIFCLVSSGYVNHPPLHYLHQAHHRYPLFAHQHLFAVPGKIVHQFNEAPGPVPVNNNFVYPLPLYPQGNPVIREEVAPAPEPGQIFPILEPPAANPQPLPQIPPPLLPSPAKVIHKHVSIHVPPEELEEEFRHRIIHPKLPEPEQHVNVIFIKAPSTPSQNEKTEIVLPETPLQKTLVYVLVKKPGLGEDNLRIRGPPPTLPPKPQVYFIRYKDHGAGQPLLVPTKGIH